jgi:hypothetical protein
MKNNTVQRNIWQELESWAEGFQPWQKLALCHAIRYGSLADSQIDEVYSVFLHNNAKRSKKHPSAPAIRDGLDHLREAELYDFNWHHRPWLIPI